MPNRLLLVDDEPRNLSLLEAYLAPLGYETVHAGSGHAALEAVSTQQPDLVLLDVVMPDLDGIDVLMHIRATEAGNHTPVILITGQTEREDRLRGLEAGADEFLEKPVDRALLLARVRTLLRSKEAADALVERNVELRRLQQDQRELTELIVHDLKSPLAAIHMTLGWLRANARKIDEEELAEAIADAQLASTRLQSMVEQMLVVARIEQAGLTLNREHIAVSEVASEVARVNAREAAERGIVLAVDADARAHVVADGDLLRRVVSNLVENALRHTPRGGRVAIATKHGTDVEIAVSNDGQAVPEEERERVFAKFHRVGRSGARHRNAGLGLYFCKRAIEAHGGTIALTRIDDFATSFVIRLASA